MTRLRKNSILKRIPIELLLIPFIIGIFSAPAARAQPSVQIHVSKGPYYKGVPMEVQIHIEGIERSPEPSCSAEDSESGTLRLVGLVPNITTHISMINGRTTRTEVVKYVCRYSFIPARPGVHHFPPFRIQQGAEVALSRAQSIVVEKLASDPRVRIRLKLPQNEIFIGQRLPVEIEWWIDESLQEKIQSYEIHSELFEERDRFRFAPDPSPEPKQQTLEIGSDNGKIRLPASVEIREEKGRRFLVVSAERTMTPLKAGDFHLEAATLTLKEVTRWQRDLFGGRRPTSTRPVFGRDSDLVLRVKAPPSEGRPESFAGAIGRGFSLEVSADRSVVQRGDPILLTFSIRGEGELANVRLPALTHEDALPPQFFGLPEGEITGELVDDAKIFRIPVRILDESVQQIPALPFSYFDPSLGLFQTSESRPIALSVRPAQMISSEDVVAAPSRNEAGERAGNRRQEPLQEMAPNLTGANLAIELDHGIMLRQPGLRDSTRHAAYMISVALFLGAVAYRRKSDENPESRRKRALYKKQRERIEAASGLPRREGLGELASALRELAILQTPPDPIALEDFLTECDNVFYSPQSQQEIDPAADPYERAGRLADEIGAELAKGER